MRLALISAVSSDYRWRFAHDAKAVLRMAAIFNGITINQLINSLCKDLSVKFAV
ncbi:hypothetical protein QZJ86_14720 [Methylomonas montana]|uniref:hypothetical protein n=1 Tax=Methylomonas montana TaxID=3058963 RepID=UPI00265ADECA|nr:hypothetical protein [Methylomonas montana]WKJ89271.1 hypothetical protein QZJ86_14720 [Methylomonas montana]